MSSSTPRPSPRALTDQNGIAEAFWPTVIPGDGAGGSRASGAAGGRAAGGRAAAGRGRRAAGEGAAGRCAEARRQKNRLTGGFSLAAPGLVESAGPMLFCSGVRTGMGRSSRGPPLGLLSCDGGGGARGGGGSGKNTAAEGGRRVATACAGQRPPRRVRCGCVRRRPEQWGAGRKQGASSWRAPTACAARTRSDRTRPGHGQGRGLVRRAAGRRMLARPRGPIGAAPARGRFLRFPL